MSVIYKIYSDEEDVNEIYVGSTCRYQDRIIDHKSACKNEKSDRYNLKVYQYIRENGGFDCFKSEVLECVCDELRFVKERYWIEKLEAKLNTTIPTRNMKEWSEQYREKNKDKIAEQMKEYRENNKDKLVEYMKEYREKNKDKLVEYKKEYQVEHNVYSFL